MQPEAKTTNFNYFNLEQISNLIEATIYKNKLLTKAINKIKENKKIRKKKRKRNWKKLKTRRTSIKSKLDSWQHPSINLTKPTQP